MYTPEADFEYLIRTLSEARSRATELAVSIGSRLGGGHRLTELANSAASNIETTLREVRSAAVEKPDSASGLTDLHAAVRTQPPPDVPAQSIPVIPNAASFAATAGVDSEHWLSAFVEELLTSARTSGRITFESTERLLQQRKDEFLRDFLIARRMYRAYPHLFPEIADQTRHVIAP